MLDCSPYFPSTKASSSGVSSSLLGAVVSVMRSITSAVSGRTLLFLCVVSISFFGVAFTADDAGEAFRFVPFPALRKALATGTEIVAATFATNTSITNFLVSKLVKHKHVSYINTVRSVN